MNWKGVLALLLVAGLPATALAAEPQALELSAKAQVEGATVPLGVIVSTESPDVTLSPTKKDGATAVTVTLYIVPNPKPAPQSQPAAAIESSQNIQQSIGNISPAAETYAQPMFSTLDSARSSAADVLDQQLASTRVRLAPDQPGQVLGAEATKNAADNPTGAFWYALNTLYFYLLTLLRFIVGSAGVFYPAFAVAFFYILWRTFKRFRRPAY